MAAILDIKDDHVLLAGVDPFLQLEVTREQIQLRDLTATYHSVLKAIFRPPIPFSLDNPP